MSSVSASTSVTDYANTPVTVSDIQSSLILAGSRGAQVGGSGNISAGRNLTQNRNESKTLSGNAQINTLDGGAIQAAMDLGSQSIGQIAQLTKDVLAAQASGAVSALNFADKQATTAQAVAEKNVNANPDTVKYIIYAVVGLGLAYLMKGKF